MFAVMTGRKVLAIFVAMFGTIIAVNLTLAVNAVRTFPGLEVKNSYVASQVFDAERAAQEALGWDVAARLEGGELVLDLRGADGAPVGDAVLHPILGRATSVADDTVPAFVFDGEVWRAPVALGRGNWDLRLKAVAADGTPYRTRLKLDPVR